MIFYIIKLRIKYLFARRELGRFEPQSQYNTQLIKNFYPNRDQLTLILYPKIIAENIILLPRLKNFLLISGKINLNKNLI